MNSRSGSIKKIYQSIQKRAETRSLSRDKKSNHHHNEKDEFISIRNDKPPKHN